MKMILLPPERITVRTKNMNDVPEDNPGYVRIREAIRKFGVLQPLVVDKKNILIDGYVRLQAVKDLNLKLVPVVQVDVTEEESREIDFALNTTLDVPDLNTLTEEIEIIPGLTPPRKTANSRTRRSRGCPFSGK